MEKKYVIKLPIEPNCSDDMYYEENADCSIAVFDEKDVAVQYLIDKGLSDRELALAEIVGSIGTCFRCGSPLFPSDIKDYESQCFTCDEDFYSIEQECETK